MHRQEVVMCRLVILLLITLLAGCGNGGISHRSEARERPPVEARRLGDIAANQLTLPNHDRSIKFAIIGDSGRGSKEQHEIAAQMVAYRQRFDYRFVLMAGDNIYEGPATGEDYRLKFEEPYKLLLDAGVRFYAVLGNHDDSNQIFYKPFNMDGRRYYTFVPPVDPLTRWDTRVRFFALDSTYLSFDQIRWFEKEVTESRAE
ncbi:MAG TPA: metallophosphoesterase, partial [Vicinamibacterales bacterium]|nr:metallophosphoesterase [Vicinamibacterales bacterium]